MVAGSLAALRLGGSLVEISKRDIWSAAAAGAERPDVAFRLLAVDFLPAGVIQQQLATIAAGAAAGVLRPLPVVAHGLGSVAAAMRQMSQARHVGKIVVNNPQQGAIEAAAEQVGCRACSRPACCGAALRRLWS
jgi:hypothetical protein